MKKINQKWVLYSCIAQCRVKSIGSSAGCTVWQQQEGRTCDTSTSHTVHWVPKELPSAVRVTCRGWDSYISRDDSLSIILLSPTTCTWVKRASQDEAGFLYKFIKSPQACCWDAAAPADYTENGWCHHRIIESALCSPKVLSFLNRWSLLWPFLYVAAVWSVQSSLLFMWTPRYL